MKLKLVILVLVLFVSYINYMDRVSLSFAILEIQSAYGISNEQFGYLFSIFGVGYLLMMFFTGILIDKFGSIKIWAISALFWSIFVALTGLTRNYTELLIVRFCLGASEAFHFPALVKTIADWIDPKLRVGSVAIGFLGFPLALLFGGPFITAMIESFGFRIMFFILGGIGLFWVIIWLYCFHGEENPKYNQKVQYKEKRDKIPFKVFFTSGFFLSNCIFSFFIMNIYFFILSWLPGYLEEVYDVPLIDVGLFTAIPWTTGALLGLAFSFFSDWLHIKSASLRAARTYPFAFACFVTAACFFGLTFKMGFRFEMFLFSVGFGFMFGILPLMHALNSDLFKFHVGSAVAVMMCFMAFSAIFSPSIAGLLIREAKTSQPLMLIYAAFALISGIGALIFQREKKLKV